MNNMKLKFSTLIAILLTLSPVITLAHDAGEPHLEPAELREQITHHVADRLCTKVENRIKLQIKYFENAQRRRTNAYQNTQARLAGLKDNLTNRGFDTVQLGTDLETLQLKIDTYSKAFDDFMVELKQAQELSCGESDGAFKDSITKARELLQQVRSLGLDIRSFLAETIRPELVSLKSQSANQEEN